MLYIDRYVDIFVNCNWVTPGGSSTVHIYTQTVHRTTQLIRDERGPCPVFTSYTLAFALHMRKTHAQNLSQGTDKSIKHIKCTGSTGFYFDEEIA